MGIGELVVRVGVGGVGGDGYSGGGLLRGEWVEREFRKGVDGVECHGWSGDGWRRWGWVELWPIILSSLPSTSSGENH